MSYAGNIQTSDKLGHGFIAFPNNFVSQRGKLLTALTSPKTKLRARKSNWLVSKGKSMYGRQSDAQT